MQHKRQLVRSFHKLLLVFGAAAIVMLLAGAPALAQCPTCPGDVNGDSKVNGDDIQCFVDCALGTATTPPCNCDCADMDGDGTVGISDVRLFINALFAKVDCPLGNWVLADDFCIDCPCNPDFDGDGILTQADTAFFNACMADPTGPGCGQADLDCDGDIDADDSLIYDCVFACNLAAPLNVCLDQCCPAVSQQINTVRWYGSYLDPAFDPSISPAPLPIDGWLIGFHQDIPPTPCPAGTTYDQCGTLIVDAAIGCVLFQPDCGSGLYELQPPPLTYPDGAQVRICGDLDLGCTPVCPGAIGCILVGSITDCDSGISRPGSLIGLWFIRDSDVAWFDTLDDDCKGESIFCYETELPKGCIIHAYGPEVDPLTCSFIGAPDTTYWISIQAEVGHTYDIPAFCQCGTETPTGNTASGPFWGWHTTPDGFQQKDDAYMGSVIMGGAMQWIFDWTGDLHWCDFLNCVTDPTKSIDLAYYLINRNAAGGIDNVLWCQPYNAVPPPPPPPARPLPGEAAFDEYALTDAFVDIEVFGFPPEVLSLQGPTIVAREPVVPGAPPTIDTEIISMNLTGNSINFGPVILNESPALSSTGIVVGNSNYHGYPAQAFFNVFVEINAGGMVLFNDVPVPISTTIDFIPPANVCFDSPPTITVPLKDKATNQVVGNIRMVQHCLPYQGGIDIHSDIVWTDTPPVPTVFPVQPTNCPVVVTTCPPAVPTVCPQVPTVCPAKVTACPAVATQCPAQDTQCPQVYTECPQMATYCPPLTTYCPSDPTVCDITCFPVFPTQCEFTVCPVIQTECPQDPTNCPVKFTVCPVITTYCGDITTVCPEEYTICPATPTECVDVPTICDVFTECPTDPTYCPFYYTVCPQIYTQCWTDPTICNNGTVTECSGITTQCTPTNCVIVPTICAVTTECPTSYTSCPQIPTECITYPTICQVFTECPQDPTFCPPISTECPVSLTTCPDIFTWCPDIPTYCPEIFTQCPIDFTTCPQLTTECPYDPTNCPVTDTWCPILPTDCPFDWTNCPQFTTECPQNPTNCPVQTTECPQATTACPVDPTNCPIVNTECPVIPTQCEVTCYPVVPTECPVVLTTCPTAVTECPTKPTECPTVPTQCEATVCPQKVTVCPRQTTWCPVIPTVCDVTNCPVIETQCPLIETVCPEVITVCRIEPTVCPLITTECPDADPTICEFTVCPTGAATQCPQITTQCPVVPTECEFTICPPIETQCPIVDTECPVVAPTICEHTICPAIQTECPVQQTQCPSYFTVCPKDPTPTWCPLVLTQCPVLPPICWGSTCRCDGDLNSDGVVDAFDLNILLSCLGQPPTGACASADINCDGVIDNGDVNALQCLMAGGTPQECCPNSGG